MGHRRFNHTFKHDVDLSPHDVLSAVVACGLLFVQFFSRLDVETCFYGVSWRGDIPLFLPSFILDFAARRHSAYYSHPGGMAIVLLLSVSRYGLH